MSEIIRVKEGYLFGELSIGVFHISSGSGFLCRPSFEGYAKATYDQIGSEYVCKNCLKHTDAYEVVEEEDAPIKRTCMNCGLNKPGQTCGQLTCFFPELDYWEPEEEEVAAKEELHGYQMDGDAHVTFHEKIGAFPDGEAPGVSYGDLPILSGPNELTGINYSITVLDGGGHKVMVEGQEFVPLASSVQTDNSETLKNALAAMEELQIENEELRKRSDQLKVMSENGKRIMEEFKKTCNELRSERDELKSKLAEEKERHQITMNTWQALEAATASHTPEHVREIMKAIPHHTVFGDATIEYRLVRPDERYWDLHKSELTRWDAQSTSISKRLVITPIVEYIENDDITDEMVVAAGGRVPCEVGTSSQGWLIAVEALSNDPLIVMHEDGSCEHMKRAECRIKKSDLEVSE